MTLSILKHTLVCQKQASNTTVIHTKGDLHFFILSLETNGTIFGTISIFRVANTDRIGFQQGGSQGDASFVQLDKFIIIILYTYVAIAICS